ncbi:MAG: hypothetical protein ACU0AX_01200 [Roseovarius sp.]|uniref:hypothetical protein n=1 Tax=Roseovarius sp. TaxID=1486281 RepID=UPI004058B962
MIELGRLSAGLAGAGAVSLAVLGVAVLRDPASGLRLAGHHAENLPQVMANRYLALAVLAVLAMLQGDAGAIAALFGVLGLMGLHDATIYARAGHGWGRHAAAGCAAFAVAGLAWLARAGGI